MIIGSDAKHFVTGTAYPTSHILVVLEWPADHDSISGDEKPARVFGASELEEEIIGRTIFVVLAYSSGYGGER